MRTLKTITVATALARLLPACASVEVGKPFDPGLFCAKAQRGVTTQADVSAWLGEAPGIGFAIEPSGETYYEWTYYHAEGHLPRMADARLVVLQVKFDTQGVMRGYTLTASDRPAGGSLNASCR
jgi:hypothetical protein